MRKLSFILIMLTALLTTSCSDGKYEVMDDIVVFRYWTFSFGYVNDTLPHANSATFVSVKDWLGHDGTHVYFQERQVQGADAPTLKADRFPLFHDKRDYYFKGAPLHVADVKSFDVLKRNDEHIWASDEHFAYYDSTRIEKVDIKTFKVKKQIYAIDKNRVYLYGKELKDADPSTFEYLDWGYSRDKSHVWHYDDVLDGVDVESFEVDKNGNATDKNGLVKEGF